MELSLQGQEEGGYDRAEKIVLGQLIFKEVCRTKLELLVKR